ncbi:hypothetical protein NTGHW29_420034 [Candidatus Nitrotoga sp. HW29]|nr:hypothetical protein NTGHW29_420034 [Candidatus Nitrotoga sp. HW29]
MAMGDGFKRASRPNLSMTLRTLGFQKDVIS